LVWLKRERGRMGSIFIHSWTSRKRKKTKPEEEELKEGLKASAAAFKEEK